MKDIKIAFFDIDGTIVDMNTKVISKKMKETLIRLKENGIMIGIATGRPAMNIPHFDFVEFDVYLTFNGSYCFNQKEVIFKQPIPIEDVQKIIENGKRIGRPAVLASLDRMGANGKDDPDLIEYFGVTAHPIVVIEDFDEFSREEIYQIMMGGRVEEYDQILAGAEGAEITAWWDRAVDIIPFNCGKGTGIERILAYYGLSKEEAIAFGDGSNDIEMLKTVGTGIAMGNATEDVKEIADDICGTVMEDGIYKYCIQKHLI